jgi:Bacterial Ig-like domain (group 3)
MGSSIHSAFARAIALLALFLCFAFAAGAAHAQGQGLAAVGPNGAHGFPLFFQDRQGLALEPCLVQPTATTPVPDPCFLTGTLPLGDASPIVFPTNFPDEFFWMRATADMGGVGGNAANRAVLVLALEGAFAGAVADGQQIVFARFRLRVDGLAAGQTYKVIYPYGEQTFQAVAAPNNQRMINVTDDQGCLAVPCGTFDGVLTSTNVGPFLQWDPAVGPAAPAGFIGDPAVPHAITGSTFPDHNKFRLEGPNVGGPGVNFIETPLFTLIGKKFTGVVPPPLTVNRASYVRPAADSAQINVFVQSSGAATVVASGAGIPDTTLTRDAATGRFFAPIVPTSPTSLPSFIRFTATAPGAPQTVLDKALVDEVAVSNATFDENVNTLTVQAASSDRLAPAPVLEARDSIGPLGVLVNGALTHAMPVPAAQVIVSSSAGGVAVLPVTLVKRTPVATSTVLAASPNPALRPQAVTLTATVAAASGTDTPTGSVTFRNGTATLGTATLNASGVATLTVAANTLTAATHALTAEYAGVASFFLASTSNQVNLTVQLAPTTTVLTASAASIVVNQSVTLTATVSANGVGTPGGTVQFRDGGANLGAAVTVNASGVATLVVPANTFTASAAGVTHALSAVYSGNASYLGSTSATLNLLVTTPAVTATTTTLAASANPIASDQPVTLTATVAPNPGAGGTVTFRDTSTNTNLGTATLNASGVASFTVAANTLTGSTAGTVHALTAAFAGTASFGASTSAALNLTVNAPAAPTLVATTTSVTTSPNPSSGFQTVTFTATVRATSGTAIPGGSVTVRIGTTVVGTANVNAQGVVQFTRNSFQIAAGTHQVTATYAGNSTFAASTSPVHNHVDN